MVDVQRLRALVAAATPGPWKAGDGDAESILSTVTWHCVAQANDALPHVHDNAALIVAAVNALPELLAIAEAYNAGTNFKLSVNATGEASADDLAVIEAAQGQTVRLVRVVGEAS